MKFLLTCLTVEAYFTNVANLITNLRPRSAIFPQTVNIQCSLTAGHAHETTQI